MNIAFYNLTTTTKTGGIETFNFEMAKTLAGRGHRVHIFGGKGGPVQEMPGNVKILMYPFLERSKIPDLGTRFRKFIERLSFGAFAFRDLIKGNYNYIYVSKPFDLPVVLLASAFSKAKVIFGSGGTEFFPGYKSLVKKVDHFFSVSEFNAAQIHRYCVVMPSVLPNAVNTDIFKQTPPDMKLREELGLRDNEYIIISACRLVGWKGIQFSIKAVHRMIRKGHVIKYLIIGDGEDKKNLQALAKEMQIEDSVIFLGNLPNSRLPHYYSLSHTAVFPSIADETFGISIAEAMACGIPVVSTAVGGIPEVVAGDGLLVPPKDEEALAEAFEKLMADRGLREKMGDDGRKRVLANFSWNTIAEKFEGYIKNG